MQQSPNSTTTFEAIRGTAAARIAGVLGGVALLAGCAEPKCTETVEHTVSYSDTAWSLVEQYSNPDRTLHHQTLIAQTRELNPDIEDIGRLREGQKIKLYKGCK